MKIILLFIILVSYSNIFAQEKVQINSRRTDEVYQALKKNKSVKEGVYIKYYKFSKRKKKEIIGYYSNNKKDSIWRYFDWSGILYKEGSYKEGLRNGQWNIFLWNNSKPSSQGEFKNGVKVGIWDYFNENGILIHKFNHSDIELLYYTHQENATSEQPNDLGKGSDSKAMVLGGHAGFLRYIRREFQYPEEAQLNMVSGKVFVNFDVDETFKKSNYKVTNNPGYGIGEEAIRLIEEGPLFIPPKKDGKYIGMNLSIPITFELR